MKRNQYIEAQEADEGTVRQPWDESQFSKALAVRERTLLRQDRLSTVFLLLCVGLGLLSGLLLMMGFRDVGAVFLLFACAALVVLITVFVWQTFSAWRNSLMFEASLFRGAVQKPTNLDKKPHGDTND